MLCWIHNGCSGNEGPQQPAAGDGIPLAEVNACCLIGQQHATSKHKSLQLWLPVQASTSQYAAPSWASASAAASAAAEEGTHQAWDDVAENVPPHNADTGTQLAALSTIGTTRWPPARCYVT